MAASGRVAKLRFLVRLVLLVCVPLAVVVVALGWYARSGRVVDTDNAYVKSHIVAVSADVAGRVVEVGVRDNQRIAAGTPLFRIDPTPFALEVERAEAQMAVVRTEVESLRAEHRIAQAEAQEAEERIAFLRRQLDRQQRMKERGMSREDQFDEARSNLETAERRLQAIRERAARVIAGLGGDLKVPAERHPRYQQALTARDTARLDVKRTLVLAPSAGVVSNMRLQPGEHVAKGVPVFSIVEAGEPWIEANFKETQLTNVRVGQAATVVADAFPDHAWRARIRTIAPATGAEFAVLPPQNATGNWVKVVQRVPVHIDVEFAKGDPPLRAGMTVTVSVDTGHARGLPKPLERLIESGAVPAFVRNWLRPPAVAAAPQAGLSATPDSH